MANVLIVATTSYAGMGPYVTSIYNTLSPEVNVYFLGREYSEEYFKRNIKEDLLSQCVFYKKANTHWNTLVELFLPDNKFEDLVLETCALKQIDIVHYINRPVPTSMIKKLHKKGIKTLGTVHDLHPHEAKKVWYKMFRHWKSRKDLHRDVCNADNLLTNSAVQLEELKQLYADKKIFYAPFPSLVTPVISEGTLLPMELKSCSKPYILFFGLIEEYKGIDILLKAYLASKDIQDKYNLVIAGRGDLKEEWQVAENKGVVFINRFIKDQEVRKMYEGAEMVIYPYISATQSGVLSIAFYFGTPTIVSDVPFFRSIVEPTGAGLIFKAGDCNSLVSKIFEMEHCKENVINAERKTYQTNYENTSVRNKMLEIYDSL